jgi:alpha-L-arabinofuranosidase
MREHFAGAYLYNLAEWGTWGVMANPVDFRLRPSGLAFSMLAPVAGQSIVATRAQSNRLVVLKSGKGNNPKNTEYPTLAAVAARSGKQVQLAVLNRSFEGSETVQLEIPGATVVSADLYRLGPERLDANNEEKADLVRISKRALSSAEFSTLEIPARSLSRIVFTLK